MRIFLTGGTGFIGSNLLNYFAKKNVDVTALKRTFESKTKLYLKKEPNWVIGSFNSVEKKHLSDQDILVHLAAHTAQPPYDNLQNCILNNVVYPLNLFDKAYDAGVRKFLIAGSCFEYGLTANQYDQIPPNASLLPTDTYPASKAMASIAFIQWALEKKVSLSIERIFYVFGEGENRTRFYQLLKQAAISGKDFEISKGEQIRDISEVKTVIKKLFFECQEIHKRDNFDVRINNIGSGKNLSLKKFAKKLWHDFDAKGHLKIGTLPYRKNEIMRYVPELKESFIISDYDR